MMKTKQTTPLKYARFGAALTSLALVIMQFLPYWESEDKTVSVAQYQWFPKNYKPLTTALQEVFGKEYSLNELGGWSISVLIFGVVALVLFLLHFKKPAMLDSLVFIFVGVSGLLMISNPVFRTGSLWQAIMVASIILTVFGVLYLVDRILDLRTIAKKPWEEK